MSEREHTSLRTTLVAKGAAVAWFRPCAAVVWRRG